jgi:hypothetical protein
LCLLSGTRPCAFLTLGKKWTRNKKNPSRTLPLPHRRPHPRRRPTAGLCHHQTHHHHAAAAATTPAAGDRGREGAAIPCLPPS